MKKQWACSACSSRWKSFMKPVVMCNACRSKKKLSQVGFSVGKFGMVFENLTFEPANLALPLIIHGKSQPVTAHHHCVTSHFYSYTTTIQIKQEYEGEERDVVEEEKEAIWDSNKVKKRKRSKLPQYTLSPLSRLIGHLQGQASTHRRRRSAVVGTQYDDVLIYQKCLYVAENEIGLGAELLSPPPVHGSAATTTTSVIEGEPSSTNDRRSAVDNIHVNSSS